MKITLPTIMLTKMKMNNPTTTRMMPIFGRLRRLVMATEKKIGLKEFSTQSASGTVGIQSNGSFNASPYGLRKAFLMNGVDLLFLVPQSEKATSPVEGMWVVL